ncbi:hypothetical protein FRC09_001880 [Ceratobasidium sp. 395]|nr:hypothetical protein FRC09_001880 [Ceratobasidium sp. 395]
MHIQTPLAVLAALVVDEALASPTVGFDEFNSPTLDIDWRTCRPGSKALCGTFRVLLDYTKPAAGWTSLAVARYPAKHSKRGTLFLNPGGPGDSGIDMIIGAQHTDRIGKDAEKIMDAVGGKYDLVSWDPRGVGSRVAGSHNIGRTSLRADCFDTGSEENDFWKGTIPHAGLEARGNFTDAHDLKIFYAQVESVDERLQALGAKCLEYSKDTFPYIGTTATVKDMVALHDALEGSDKPVNFWGLSYGTAIGIYFANMYPNRVGKVVLDGVVDPTYWANRPAHEMWSINAESADEALAGFVEDCAKAGPGKGKCEFASEGSKPEDLIQKIKTILDLSYIYKQIAGDKAQFGSALVRDGLYKGMYSPTEWPGLRKELQHCWTFLNKLPSRKNRCFQDLYGSLEDQSTPTNRDPPNTYSLQGITCADAVDRNDVTTEMVFESLVNVTRNVSQMFGPKWGIGGLYCHQWPVRAVERYAGPWNKTLSNKIIIIGNKADPITPLKSARSAAAALGDSAVLVEQDAWGHTSLAMHSTCMLNILKSYFLKNEYPAANEVCKTDEPISPGVTTSTLGSLISTTLNSPNSGENSISIQLVRQWLPVIIGSFSCASGLLFVWVAVSWTIWRRVRHGKLFEYTAREGLDKEKLLYATK